MTTPQQRAIEALREVMKEYDAWKAKDRIADDRLSFIEARAALAAVDAEQAEPVQEPVAGWKLVPVEPTREMIQAACDKHGYPGGDGWVYRDGYNAMLAVAPTPPTPQRKPLTDEQIDALWRAPMPFDWEHREFARAVEEAVWKNS